MKILQKHKKFLMILILSLCVIAAVLYTAIDKSQYFISPDGNYSISVYRVPLIIGSIGGGSDAPGVIVLANKYGLPLRVCTVDMVQNVSAPDWKENKVYMKLVFDWHL